MDYNKLLTHGSLFSGIGGFDLAAEWSEFQNIFHADNNDFCRQTLEYQFPNSDSYAYITTTDFSKYRHESQCLQVDSRANHSPWQENEREQQTTVTSGQQCLMLFGRSDRLGLLVKMLLESPRWYSPVRSLNWKTKPIYSLRIIESSKPKSSDSLSTESVTILSKQDIASNRLLFRLAASARLTSETGYGSLHDLMKRELLPTPLASDATMGAVIGRKDTFRITPTGTLRKVNRNGQNGSVGLARLVKLWDLLPTPTAADATRGGEIVTGHRKIRPSGTEYSLTLNDLAKSGLLPTPVASDHNGGATRTDPSRQFSCALQDYVHGVAQQKDKSLIGHSSQLNPRFTLEMMGFPVNWLDAPYHIKSGEPKR